MKIKIKKKQQKSGIISISFDGEMTIYSVVKLQKYFINELMNSQGIDINLSNINKIDTAGFQLILYLKREGERANKTISFLESNDKVKSIFNLYKEII
jgi:anti-sigma B factor antagonist